MDGSNYSVHWGKPICKEPGNYVAWPTIARRPDGELLVVFSGDREEHVCPYGKTELIRSRDAGETWSRPEVINNSPLDDRDAGIIVLKSGTLVMSSFTHETWDKLDMYRGMGRWSAYQIDAWDRYCRKLSQETRQRWLGNWTRRSTDGGQTWEPAVNSIGSGPHGPNETHDGQLVSVGTVGPDGRDGVVCAESTDEARSWRRIGAIPISKEHKAIEFSEPHVVEVSPGELVCVLRTEMGIAGVLYASRSSDGGKTWSTPEPTPLNGYDQPGHLKMLSDGRLLCTYGRRAEPFGQRACLSEDGGRTWEIGDEMVLRDDSPNTDMGYPATAEITPGEMLTVYYQVDRPGEKVSINATRWSLN